MATKTSPGHPPTKSAAESPTSERKVSFGGTVVTDRKRNGFDREARRSEDLLREFVVCVYNPETALCRRELAARPEVRLILVTANLCAAATSPSRRQYRRLTSAPAHLQQQLSR